MIETNKAREPLKIVQLNRLHAEKLKDLADFFQTSSRRALQFCLAYSIGLESLAKPPRTLHMTKGPAKVIFIPFNSEQLKLCSTRVIEEKRSFNAMCHQAIEHAHTLFKSSKLQKQGKEFLTYIGR